MMTISRLILSGLIFGALVLPGVAPAQPVIGNADAGQKTFEARCATCHALEPGRAKKKGPHMQGIFGRTAGTQKGFRYSKTMRQSALVWDAYTLDNYLYDPPHTMKGTSMVLKTPEPKDRADLIAYLKTL
ncbi:c-type cytochrome [Niveispirillum sp. SYP-B3756]|uniref:c-type cytochrome n=1 Tax=Niveispirillum sp. SYP-B3756 TaxID=2662178 RepID=UPI001290C8FD|nr:c-type cytochrome [Niveispirillum sp. SYP-B3756]MQP67706.1 c-type cytochrome [Niveispirillum sp. SYP-B3756]